MRSFSFRGIVALPGAYACSLALSSLLLLSISASSALGVHDSQEHLREEYQRLYAVTEDKDALEAIRSLHEQLDDDNDGTIEPSETGDFIRGDLHYSSGDKRERQKNFHKKDSEITVSDLWVTWKRSEVYNWTAAQVEDWLVKNVELPQYVEHFKKAGVNGTHLPKAAVSSSFLSKVVGISSSIHRSKISLKAMDVVLFGAPRDNSSFLKDVILTSLLVIAVTGLFYAYRQNKRSQQHLKKMMTDMDSLAKAEQTLQELQEKLQQKDSKIESLSSSTPPSDLPDAVEVSRLKEELEVLRNELHRAEVELEDKCWMASPVLQHWLQLTYELESQTYNAKKKAAEEQLEVAKDMCERLKRKRSSLVGAFVSTHGRSIDDVDRSILEAKTALMEVTKDLTERSQRWRQIEMLCGCSIINNPGIAVLTNLVRHVGAGRGVAALHSPATNNRMSSRLSSSISQDDLTNDQDFDAHSVAASSSHMSHISRPSSLLSSAATSSAIAKRSRADLKAMSRESSKESSSSDELDKPLELTATAGMKSLNLVARSATPPVGKTASPATKRGMMMVKSLSQDAGGTMQAAAAALSGGSTNSSNVAMANSVSESLLQSAASQSSMSAAAEGGSSAALQNSQMSNPSIVEELEESCSASECGSVSDLSAAEKDKKKKRSFFNFRRKKEKKVEI